MAFGKKFCFVLLTSALVCAIFSACAKTVPAEPSSTDAVETAAPAPEPTPTPEPTEEELCALCESEFRSLFAPDYSGYDYVSQGMLDMPGLIEKQPMYVELSDAARTLAQASAQSAAQSAKSASSGIKKVSVTVAGSLDWRLMAAICTFIDSPEQAVTGSTSVSAKIDGTTLHVTVTLSDFESVFSSLESSVHYGALSLYSYLNTTYDNNAEIIDNDGSYELSDEYIATIMDPFPRYHIKDGWYGDRSHSTRRHMGTDIRVSEGKDIPSCTAGTVVRIAYNDIAGNYVTILDDYGFYYSYCHMVELTTFLAEGDRVEQGQLIGHIGNTGNSDAPHLHLSIITPEYTYINPYPVLARVRYGN